MTNNQNTKMAIIAQEFDLQLDAEIDLAITNEQKLAVQNLMYDINTLRSLLMTHWGNNDFFVHLNGHIIPNSPVVGVGGNQTTVLDFFAGLTRRIHLKHCFDREYFWVDMCQKLYEALHCVTEVRTKTEWITIKEPVFEMRFVDRELAISILGRPLYAVLLTVLIMLPDTDFQKKLSALSNL